MKTKTTINTRIAEIIRDALNGSDIRTIGLTGYALNRVGWPIFEVAYKLNHALESGKTPDLEPYDKERFDDEDIQFFIELARGLNFDTAKCTTLRYRLKAAKDLLTSRDSIESVLDDVCDADLDAEDVDWVNPPITEKVKSIVRAIALLPTASSANAKEKIRLNKPMPITNERTPEKLVWLN